MDFINAIILLLNYTVIPALTYGSQLALGAIFVTLVYGILRFANFATGDMMSFGTMVAVLLTFYFQSLGISFGFLPTALLTIPPAILAMIFYMLFILISFELLNFKSQSWSRNYNINHSIITLRL